MIPVNIDVFCKPQLVLLILVMCISAGCGGSQDVAVVTGNVTFDDQLLDRGVVMFFPVEGEAVSLRTGIQPDGTYKLQVPQGEYKVTVNLFIEVDPALEPGDPGYQEPKSLLPVQFSSVALTPLKINVNEQTTDYNLEIFSR